MRRPRSRAAGRPPTQPINRGRRNLPGAGSRAPGTFEEFPFTIGPNDENAKVDVSISWASANDDFDLFVYRVEENGDRTEVTSSASVGGTGNSETATLANPGAGDYVAVVDNYTAAPPADFTGTIDFTGAAAGVDAGTGDLHGRREGRLARGARAVRPRRRQPRAHRRRAARAARPDRRTPSTPDPGRRGRARRRSTSAR